MHWLQAVAIIIEHLTRLLDAILKRKRQERQDEIRRNPADAWNRRFGHDGLLRDNADAGKPELPAASPATPSSRPGDGNRHSDDP